MDKIAFNSTIQLPRTGQTKCYNTVRAKIACAGTGQDGEIRGSAQPVQPSQQKVPQTQQKVPKTPQQTPTK